MYWDVNNLYGCVIDNFGVSNIIDEISMGVASWDLDQYNSMKIQKICHLVSGFFCILIACANIFLIARPSGN